LPLIDVAHHLYATYKAGKPIQWLRPEGSSVRLRLRPRGPQPEGLDAEGPKGFLGRWTREELIAVLEHLYRKTGDLAYRSVGELARRSLAPTTRPLL